MQSIPNILVKSRRVSGPLKLRNTSYSYPSFVMEDEDGDAAMRREEMIF